MGKRDEKRQRIGATCKWKDSNNMDFKEAGWEGVD